MNDEANLALSNHLFVIYHYLFIYKLSLVSCLDKKAINQFFPCNLYKQEN